LETLETFMQHQLLNMAEEDNVSNLLSQGEDKSTLSPSFRAFLKELASQLKGTLGAMTTFAFFARDKFKDAELVEDFY
jgi:hypothetical protein